MTASLGVRVPPCQLVLSFAFHLTLWSWLLSHLKLSRRGEGLRNSTCREESSDCLKLEHNGGLHKSLNSMFQRSHAVVLGLPPPPQTNMAGIKGARRAGFKWLSQAEGRRLLLLKDFLLQQQQKMSNKVEFGDNLIR